MISRRGMTAMKKIRKYLEDDSDDGNDEEGVRREKKNKAAATFYSC